MVTKNWYNSFKAYMIGVQIPNGLTYYSGAAANAGCYAAVASNLFFSVSSVVTTAEVGIVLGGGATQPTINDYKLESQITSGLSASVQKTTDENNSAVYILTLTNTSDKDITVAEVGMILALSRSSGNNGTAGCLVDRTVLDAPITIPAGGLGVIDYTIKLPIPTT
jgi:hypothetical protein